MSYQFDSETELILTALIKNLEPDKKVYMVGGMVRDILMNRSVHDIDLSYCGNVRKYAKRVADSLEASFFMLNQKYQTARIIYPSQSGTKRWIDIVATRDEDILIDLAHRDFTVNAIAIDLQDRTKIIDPLNGSLDLRRKSLHVCRKDSLQNDPVRILRAIRLAVQFNWKISSETLLSIKNNASKLVDISPERKRDELFRIFDLPKASIAIRILSHLDLLKHCIPELNLYKKPEISKRIYQSIATIQELSRFSHLIIGNYSPDGVMDIQEGELVLSLGRFREPLTAYFHANIHQDRSLNSLINFCVLYFGITQQSETALKQPLYPGTLPENIDILVEQAAKTLVLSSAEKKWMINFFKGIEMVEEIIQKDLPLNPEASFLFFNRTKSSGVAVCIFFLANSLIKDRIKKTNDTWRKNLELSHYFLDAYFNHFDKWINPPVYINGHDVMNVLKINNGKEIGWWIRQLKIETIRGNIKNHKDAINFLVTQKDNLN